VTDRSLLLVFAHPDDESVFAGGLASRLSDEGVRVSLLTATTGDRGRVGSPAVCAPAELGRVRTGELVEAARIAGVSRLRVLGYPDQGLKDAPADTIRRQLVEILRAARPQVVITFEPSGSNLHPDHTAISRFVTDAIAAAADPRWCTDEGAPHAVSRLLWTLPVRPWNVMRLDHPEREPGVDFVVDVAAWRDRKRAALRAHRTQHQSLERIFLSKPDADRLLSLELFRQAWGPPTAVRPAGDVFEGI